MLKVPQLDEVTYDQIIQKAISRIPARTEDWTDYNSHDPGVTVLETFAWLTDMLNYYMDATGEAHVEKYLKLLGILPEMAAPATGYVVVEQKEKELVIPEGTELLAGEIPFETRKEYRGDKNRFCAFLRGQGESLVDLTAFAGVDGDYAEAFSERQGGEEEAETAVYFGFEGPLKEKDHLYFCVEKNERRNPFTGEFRLGIWNWQIYTAEGWKDTKVLDETCGFLRSGYVRPEVRETMAFWNPGEGLPGAYYLRAVRGEHQYDCAPRIGLVCVNPLEVVQKHTVCKEGERIPQFRIGMTDGCAGQELLFDYPDVKELSLLICDEEGGQELYHCTEHLEEADFDEKVFAYDRKRQVIRFGDGIHGAVPRQKQEIYVTGLVTSLCGEGNIQAGELNRFAKEGFSGCRIWNPQAIENGRSRETLRDMLGRMEQELLIQNRLAAERDYVKRVRETPGLMIDKVHVIPGRIYGSLHRQQLGGNEVVVVVKPWSREQCPDLSPVYRETIEAWLEPFRLINMKVTVVPPRYVGVEVYGRITLTRDTPQVRKAVWDCLKSEINGEDKKERFGAVIACGRLFVALENLEGVEKVQELNLERVGQAAGKNDRGDLLLHEDALPYLRDVKIEFC